MQFFKLGAARHQLCELLLRDLFLCEVTERLASVQDEESVAKAKQRMLLTDLGLEWALPDTDKSNIRAALNDVRSRFEELRIRLFLAEVGNDTDD